MTQSKTKSCQNCKIKFIIEPEDFEFYKKIDVPEPTFCPDCRLQRRLTFRNERSLYKRKCDFSGGEIISQYPQNTPFPVYETTIFYSRDWTPPHFDYDFNKPFLEQFKTLLDKTPQAALLTDLQSMQQGSQYQNGASRNKDCYLVFASGDNENCLYGTSVDYCKDSIDNLFVRDSELCYQCIDCLKCYRLFFSQDCQNCVDSRFLFDCRNVSNSFGCVGLRNKSYCLFNKQLSKDEYYKAISEIKNPEKKFLDLILSYPHKFAKIEYSNNCSGNYIYNSNNIHNSFMVYDCEDCKYSFKLVKSKDCYDINDWGDPSHLLYECTVVGKNTYNIRFSNNCWPDCYNLQYCDSCSVSHDLFGCVGLKNKSYCILNKQYTKKEYEGLIQKIRKHMNEMPYTDKKGKVYKYGEFFPSELSPFAYNETIAQEQYPLTKGQITEQGYSWKDWEKKDYKITMKTEDVPENIKDVNNSILKEVIECEHQGKCDESCVAAFKITSQELKFYKKMDLPLPKLCPNCRHYQRFRKRTPMKLWNRKCQCAGHQSDNKIYKNTIEHPHHKDKHCPNEFMTAFSPDRKEIVYCEKCYNKEVG